MTRQYKYNMMGTLTITKTPVSFLDGYENKGIGVVSNDFASITYTSGTVNGWSPITNSTSANFDNELDIDWYKYTGTTNKSVKFSLSGSTQIANKCGLAVYDSKFNFLSNSPSYTYNIRSGEVYYIAAYVKDGQYEGSSGQAAWKKDWEYALNISTVQDSANLSHEKVTQRTSFFTGQKVPANLIYVNSPEWIAGADIIQSITERHPNNQLIYRQTGVKGYNTMYVTQSTLNFEDMPTKKFYYDIDFHNNSNSTVTLRIKKPYARANSGWGQESSQFGGLRYLYLERLWDDNLVETVSIAPGEHKLLFMDIMPEKFGGTKGFLVERMTSYIGIFCDFEVEGEVTVRALATYHDTPGYLRLSSGENGDLKVGNVTVKDIAPYDYKRWGEDDAANKFKGWEKNASDEVIATIKYVVNQQTPNGNLKVNIVDKYNEKPQQNMWIPNISPFSDTGDAWKCSSPSSLNAFDYTDNNGAWKFDFKHLTGAADGTTNFAGQKESNIQNYPVNSYYLNDFSRLAGLSGGERNWLSSLVFAMGNWGTKYTYYIDIYNEGDAPKKI